MTEMRFSPDFTPIEGTHIFIQWKGTDVCFDFRCECGAEGHFDGYGAYSAECGACKRVWQLPHSVSLIASQPEDIWHQKGVKVEMDALDQGALDA